MASCAIVFRDIVSATLLLLSVLLSEIVRPAKRYKSKVMNNDYKTILKIKIYKLAN